MCKKQQQRVKARTLVKNQLTFPLLKKAQNNKCCICMKPLPHVDEDISVDHVNAIATGGDNAGNLLLAHTSCNQEKGDSPADRHTLEMLAIVNWIFDYQPAMQSYKFDMRVLRGSWEYYRGLQRRREERVKQKAEGPGSNNHGITLSILMIDAQLREIERMTTSLDIIHERCELSARIF